MKKFPIQRLCVIAIMIAIYFILAKFTIPVGNLHITLASLPIVVLAVLEGPLDACIAALLGEFLIQALGQYGLTPTTPLWCIPPVLRALVVGFGCRKLCHGEEDRHMIAFMAILIVGSIATTLGNTLVTWADAVIFQYYSWAYVFGQLLVRLITGIATAVVIGIITIPIVRALRRVRPEGRRK